MGINDAFLATEKIRAELIARHGITFDFMKMWEAMIGVRTMEEFRAAVKYAIT